jgi:RNA polymerase sigma-70 factor (ECF subfamily)
MLRSRRTRREEAYEPDPGASAGSVDPAEEVLLGESVGLALMVVLETLTPAERAALVLGDLFDLPFEEIAPSVGRTPVAARQLASRARRLVRGAGRTGSAASADHEVVRAFLAAPGCERCSGAAPRHARRSSSSVRCSSIPHATASPWPAARWS